MWDIKYRPKKFADVLGQQGNVKLLKARLQRGTAFDTSYLFIGGHGQGKTTLARIHARAMLCTSLNKEDPEPCNECENCVSILKDQSEAFSERDAASQGKIEHIRAFVERLGYAVTGARMRIELFDEAHRIGDGAQDVLLKPMEEKKFVGMLCTTEPNKIKGTIRTRCEEYVIRKVTREDVLERARHVCKSEGVEFEDDALLTIIDSSGGHIRDILNKMEMVAQIGKIDLANTREYLHLGTVTLYYDILLALDQPTTAIALIEQACENVAPEEVVAGIAEAAMNSYRLANKMYTEFLLVDRSLGQKVYERFGARTVDLADYFLKNKYASRVSLLRDVLLLGQYQGNVPPKGDRPQLVIGAPAMATVAAAPAVSPAPAPTQAAPAAPAHEPTQAAQPAQPAQAAPGAPVQQEVAATAPTNGVTYVPETRLHPFDRAGEWGARPQPKKSNGVPFGEVANGNRGGLLEPDEWRRKFKRKWRDVKGA